MNGVAVGLYLVFFAAAFGWRSWSQRRRTGDTGLRLHADRGTVQWWAKLGFVVALAGGVAAPIAGLAGLAPLDLFDSGWVRSTGVLLAAAGIAATLAAQWQMGTSWRVGVDQAEHTDLVTGGVFGWVRNPIFAAMLLAAVGLMLMVGNLVAVVALVALVAALEAQVRLVEEPYLRGVHGDAYLDYAGQVGRFLPGLGRLALPSRPRRRQRRSSPL